MQVRASSIGSRIPRMARLSLALSALLANCASPPRISEAFREEQPASIRIAHASGPADETAQLVELELEGALKRRGYTIELEAGSSTDAQLWFTVLEPDPAQGEPRDQGHASVTIEARLESLTSQRELWNARGHGAASDDGEKSKEFGLHDSLHTAVAPDYGDAQIHAVRNAVADLLKAIPDRRQQNADEFGEQE
jgi:hypothetical protein